MAAPVCFATYAGRLHRWRSVFSTDASFPSKVATVTAPTPALGSDAAQANSAAVIEIAPPLNKSKNVALAGAGEGYVRSTMVCMFLGTGNDDTTAKARLIKWAVVVEDDWTEMLWVPIVLFEVTYTLSTATGAAGGLFTASHRFADTISLTSNAANDDIDISIRSPANNTIASLKVDIEGPGLLEMIFDRNSSASSCNATWQLL